MVLDSRYNMLSAQARPVLFDLGHKLLHLILLLASSDYKKNDIKKKNKNSSVVIHFPENGKLDLCFHLVSASFEPFSHQMENYFLTVRIYIF